MPPRELSDPGNVNINGGNIDGTTIGATEASPCTVTALNVTGAINHDGTTVGLYSVTPAAQGTKINDPSGGATVDAEARTAINAIIDALEAIGITAQV